MSTHTHALLATALLVFSITGNNRYLNAGKRPPAEPGFACWAAPTGDSRRSSAGSSLAAPLRCENGGSRSGNAIKREQLHHTRLLHELLGRRFDGSPQSLSAIASARTLLRPTCLVDTSAIIQQSSIPPGSPIVRAMDIFVDAQHSEVALGLMEDLLRCGAESNPVEISSRIDVLTRSASLGSLEVIDLIVSRFGGRSRAHYGWLSIARPDTAVGYNAAARIMDRAVPMSVDLFRSRDSFTRNGTALSTAPLLPTANIHAKDLLLAGTSYRALIGRGSSSASYPRYGIGGTGTALEELSAAIMRRLLESGSPLKLLTLIRPTKDTVLHLAASSAVGLILREMVAYVKTRSTADAVRGKRQQRASMNGRQLPPDFVLEAILPLRDALRARNAEGRTPLEVAALLHGKSGEAYHALVDLASLVGAKVELGPGIEHREASRNSKRLPVGGTDATQTSAGGIATATNSDVRRPGGSWHIFERATELASSRCEIDERFDLPSPEEFHREYLSLNRPVIVRAALQQGGYNASHDWSLPQLLQRYERQSVAVGSIPYWNVFNTAGSVRTLLDFIKSFHNAPPGSNGDEDGSVAAPEYAFSSDPCNTWLECSLDMLPAFVRDSPGGRDIIQLGQHQHPNLEDQGASSDAVRSTQVNKQFYLGGPRTGAPFHYHYDAVNVLAFGEKRWFLQPPARAEYSIEAPALWYQRRVADLERQGDLLECTQRDGDVVFVPESWGHATLNVESSIGVAYELRFEQG